MAALLSAQEKPAQPEVRKIPGLTTEDTRPDACVDCHANRPDRNYDGRLSTLIKSWNTKVDTEVLLKAGGTVSPGVTLTGVHPDASSAFGSIPGACIRCHRSKNTAPPFDNVIHLIHLKGAEKNNFITFFQGDCTNCHKLNMTTGAWTLPSSPEK